MRRGAIASWLSLVSILLIVPSQAALATLTGEIVTRLQVLPIEKKNDLLVVVTSSPTDPNLIDSLRFSANCRIELGVATRAQAVAWGIQNGLLPEVSRKAV